MQKLKLEIDALRVESFETRATPSDAGTVRAHADVAVENAEAITTPYTQQASCWGTCKASCYGTCQASCELGCTDGCTQYTCLSGAPVCCA
jgi:hypothetical protein